MNLSIERISGNSLWAKRRFADHFLRYEFASEYIKGKNVLDVACGTGYGTQILGKFANSAVGIDSSSASISICRNNNKCNNVKYLCQDATKLDFDDKLFSAVVSFETIEHINDYQSFLREVKRVLYPNGFFIISTPNYCGEIVKNNHHVSNFTNSQFRDLLLSKFKNVKFFYQGRFFYPFPGRGFLEFLLKRQRDIKIRSSKPDFEHAVSIAICEI